jgi:hypothetical protein
MRNIILIFALIALVSDNAFTQTQEDKSGADPTAATVEAATEPRAGNAPPNTMALKSGEARELMVKVMIARLSEELALDDEQTVLLVRQFSEHRQQLREMRRKHLRLNRELKAALRENEDEDAIEDKLSQMINNQEDMSTTSRLFHTESRVELTTWQRAKLYIFINEFDNDMRRLLSEARGFRRGGMGDGMGPGNGMGPPGGGRGFQGGQRRRDGRPFQNGQGQPGPGFGRGFPPPPNGPPPHGEARPFPGEEKPLDFGEKN